MDLGGIAPEAWREILRQEQFRLLAERYQSPPPPTPGITPFEEDLLASLLADHETPDSEYAQFERDWQQYMTQGTEQTMLVAPESPRSPTPSPISRATLRPIAPAPVFHHEEDTWLDATPMTRNVSPVEFVRYEPPTPTSHPAPPAPRRRTRVLIREQERYRLRTSPLIETAQGRNLLRLGTRPWYMAPSGFAVTQYPPTTNMWQPNDHANFLLWLERGLRVHRSTTHRLLCIENIEVFNQVLRENQAEPIIVRPTPTDWRTRWVRDRETQRGLPRFLLEGYAVLRLLRARAAGRRTS